MPPNIQPNWTINIFKYFTEQNRTSNVGIKCRIARIEVITVRHSKQVVQKSKLPF